jgi:hypothetical protein
MFLYCYLPGSAAQLDATGRVGTLGGGLDRLRYGTGVTEPLASARRAAEATTLDVGLHDPAGNQSDIASLGFIAYGKHRAVARAFDACFTSLAITAALALEFRDSPLPSALRPLSGRLSQIAGSGRRRVDMAANRCGSVTRCCARAATT